jgi:hypothetical protein
MEFVVLALFAALAAVFIGLPRRANASPMIGSDELRERRERLLQELRDLDADASEGRISGDDRLEGRRAVAPELRAVTEELRARGDSLRPAAGLSPSDARS